MKIVGTTCSHHRTRSTNMESRNSLGKGSRPPSGDDIHRDGAHGIYRATSLGACTQLEFARYELSKAGTHPSSRRLYGLYDQMDKQKPVASSS